MINPLLIQAESQLLDILDSKALLDILDSEPKAEYNRLDMLVWVIGIIEAKPSKTKSRYNRFKSFLVEKMKRGITTQEETNLSQGILNFIQTEPGTDERMKAIFYLMDGKFLND